MTEPLAEADAAPATAAREARMDPELARDLLWLIMDHARGLQDR